MKIFNTEAALAGSGMGFYVVNGKFSKADDDADGTVHRIVEGVSKGAILIGGFLNHGAINGATDVDIGLANINKGDVLSKDCITDGISLAAARNLSLNQIGKDITRTDGTFPECLKDIYVNSLATAAKANAQDPDLYDIVATLNTSGSAAGVVYFNFLFGKFN